MAARKFRTVDAEFGPFRHIAHRQEKVCSALRYGVELVGQGLGRVRSDDFEFHAQPGQHEAQNVNAYAFVNTEFLVVVRERFGVDCKGAQGRQGAKFRCKGRIQLNVFDETNVLSAFTVLRSCDWPCADSKEPDQEGAQDTPSTLSPPRETKKALWRHSAENVKKATATVASGRQHCKTCLRELPHLHQFLKVSCAGVLCLAHSLPAPRSRRQPMDLNSRRGDNSIFTKICQQHQTRQANHAI